MKYGLKYAVFAALIFLLSDCVMPNQFNVIAPGPWRAVLMLNGKNNSPVRSKREFIKRDDKVIYQEVSEGELPFTFEVVYTTPDSFYLNIFNGEEVIKVEDISYGRDKVNGDDTIRIEFPLYNSYIKAVYEDKVIEGSWFDNNRDGYSIPFVAKQGQAHRFTTLRKPPAMDVSGKWSVTFATETEQPYEAVGEFRQVGNELSGTFMTEVGDYRFLAGTVQANKLYLSTFDGTHAYLFEAKIMEDGTLMGVFQSGKHYQTNWTAKKNDAAKLGDPYKLTYLKEGYKTFDFAFKNTKGETVRLMDKPFEGKAKIIQIFGTWCPNCKDETEFLLPFYQQKPADVEVIALAFEVSKNFETAAKQVQTYVDKMKVPYPMLIAGSSDKADASAALPMLNAVISYPTLIFLNKKNEVVKIHTGFNGPATSEFKAFEKEFKALVEEIRR